MNILILGGTQFIGYHIVHALLAAGHAVTIFTRGKRADTLPASVQRLQGDRDAGREGLAALRGHTWDICFDVSGYTPRQVRTSAEMLGASVKRYVFISTGAVYAEPASAAALPLTEASPTLREAPEDVTEINGETYGPLKVTCERIVREVFGLRGTILRPQIVVGPHDPYARYVGWLLRAKQTFAGSPPMLMPGDGDDAVQVIDVRDIARFAGRLAAVEGASPPGTQRLAGAFNMAGERLTWRTFAKHIGARETLWVPAGTLQSEGLTSNELQLYRQRGGYRSAGMNISNARATSLGLTLTATPTTISDTLRWAETLPPDAKQRVAIINAERERQVIAKVLANA